MKKVFAIIVSVILLMTCLTACGPSGATLAQVKEAGKLSIATSPDFPPFESLAEGGKVEGIEIDILNIICEKLGVELEINQMDFDSVLPAIAAGKYNVGVSGISVTPKRQKNALFTDPYCLAAQAIVVLKDSPIATKADLTGKKIAVQTGTTAETYCMENKYDISAFAANNDAQSALLTGKVDAWVIDDLTAAEMVKAYNEANGEQLVILSEALTTAPYAFAFCFGSETLVAEINKIIAELLADGTVAEIFQKYDAPYTAP